MPDRALPPYAYVTRKFPHPTCDPSGHSFGKPHPAAEAPDPEQWRRCELYLWGVDLFNCGYYWEAHEAWETLWHAAGRRGPTADFLKGLIALAAAGVKAREGRAAGVQRHASRAHELFTALANRDSEAQSRFMGLELASLREGAHRLADGPERILNASDERVVPVMPFALWVDTSEAKLSS